MTEFLWLGNPFCDILLHSFRAKNDTNVLWHNAVEDTTFTLKIFV